MAFQAFQERLRQLFRRAKFDGGIVSQSTPVVEVTQTWANAQAVFYGIVTKIVDQASSASSVIQSWFVGGVPRFSILKNGSIFVQSPNTSYPSTNTGVLGTDNSSVRLTSSGSSSTVGMVSTYRGVMLYFENDPMLLGGAGINHVVIQRSGIGFWDKTGQFWGTCDIALYRSMAGVFEINSSTVGDLRDLKLRNLIGTGNLATGAVSKSADYTATTNDGTIEVDASSAACTITLFATSGNAGKIIVVKKTDSSVNTVTIDGNASETIDGATTISLASQYSTVVLQVNAAGTGWNKLAGV